MKNGYFEQDHLNGYDSINEEIKIFQECKTILDVGCGTGWFSNKLIEAYPEAEIFGTDIVDGRNFKNFNFILSDIKSLPYNSSKFDGISCKAVIEHVNAPLNAIIELNRILKEDGTLFISVPDVHDKNFWDDYTHIRPYTKNSLTTLLIDGGFDIQELWYISSVPFVGLLMKLFNIKSNKILKLFGRIGLFRSSINVIAQKK